MTTTTPRRDRPRIAVATVVNREHEALLGQVDGLAMSTWPPDVHVVLSVSDRELTRNRLPIRSDRWETRVPRLKLPGGTPGWEGDALLRAMDTAADSGAEVLVFMAVDSIPTPGLLQAYAEHARDVDGARPSVVEAEVVGLAPPGPLGYPVSSELEGWAATDDGADDDPCPVPASFALLARHWGQLRDSWRRLAQDGATPVLPADAATAAAGSSSQLRGATVYRQHPAATTARYLHGRGDRLIDEGDGTQSVSA
ncbi:hypothetical protein [uncultured Serinicoccus sp.]|uniref:hypothetical protein n=1 Tax=uncultured Serinicoccus sp. TaxID=735514 RepID=UPI0026194390|nr:hypothetical protein [uncultured Serinicoccus sp.]